MTPTVFNGQQNFIKKIGWLLFSPAFAVLLVLTFLGFALYAKVLNGEFCSDDYIYLVDNAAVRNLANIHAIWLAFPTRFLVILSFAAQYKFLGLEVFGYHLVNILIHIFNSLAVYLLAVLTFDTPALAQSALAGRKNAIAFFTALIFLCHPVQTQAVAFITQRAVTLSTGFYLAALGFYLVSRLNEKLSLRLWAALFMLGGILTKEMVITLPAVLLIYEYFLFQERSLSAIFKRLVPFLALAAALGLVFIIFPAKQVLDLNAQMQGGGFNRYYFLAELRVLVTYLRLFFLPVNQQHDYYYPVVENVLAPDRVLAVLFLTTLGFLIYKLRRRAPLVSFCLSWFFVTTSTEIMVVSFVHRWLIAEHWMYLSMFGLSLLAASGVGFLIKDIRRYRMAMTLVVLVLGLLTVLRNQVWRTEIGLWEDNVRKSPAKVSVRFALGNTYLRKGELPLAERELKTALAIFYRQRKEPVGYENRLISEIYNGLGLVYAEEKRFNQAAEALERAVALATDNIKALNNLAIVYFLNGENQKAEQTFRRVLMNQKQNGFAYLYLGQIAQAEGRRQEAEEDWRTAAEIFQDEGNESMVEQTTTLLKDLSKGQ